MDSKTLQALTVEQVISAYSGTPGCACGCRGKHYKAEDGSKAMVQIRRILGIIKKAEDEEGMQAPDAERGVTFNEYTENDVLAYETEDRLYFVHLKKQVV